MSKEHTPAWMKILAAQSYSGLSRSSIYNRLHDGTLEGRKYGKATLVSRESIDRMMANLPKFGSKQAA